MLLLTNAEVEHVLPMRDSIDAIERVYEEVASGDAVGFGRIDVYTPSGTEIAPFHRWAIMTGSSRREGYLCARMMSDMVAWPVVAGQRRETK